MRTGRLLWKHIVFAPAVVLTAIYEHKGKQYVVFAAGKNSIPAPRISDEVIALSLPD